jgi:hypothetical protein
MPFIGEKTFMSLDDAQLRFLGSELIKARQERERAARIAQAQEAETAAQVVKDATIPDGTGDSTDTGS